MFLAMARVKDSVDVVSRLDFIAWLLYHPTVCRGSLQVVTTLFSAIVTLHVGLYSSSFIIKARRFYLGEADSPK